MKQDEQESRSMLSEELFQIMKDAEGKDEEEHSYQWTHSNDLEENAFTLVGKNTHAIGNESGSFKGRWNGVWSLPIKVADGVHFAIADGSKIYLLHRFAKQFVTKLSRVERIYEIPEVGVRVRELVFIPENRQSMCWRLAVKTSSKRRLRLLAECGFDLMWEVKQAGEQYPTKKEMILYNEEHDCVVVRHNRHSEWVGIFGANRRPAKKHFGSGTLDSFQDSDSTPVLDKPFYGNVMLEYEIDTGNTDGEKDDGSKTFETDFCLTGGSLSYSEAIREFHDTMLSFELLAIEKRTLYQDYLSNTVELVLSPAEEMTRAFAWSKINLHLLEHYQSGFGTGTFAGLPHFAIYFGRDICWSLLGLLSMGDFNLARENLSLLARFQAQDNGEDMLREPFYRGEIPHEIRTEGTTYYYSADSTPLFVIAARNYLDWARDIGFTRFLYPNIVKAIDWSIHADQDEDGFIDHGPEGFLVDTTWMDSYYRGKSAIDVQAIYCRALQDGSYIARAVGDDSRAKEWAERAARLNGLILEKFWNNTTQFFYDTIEPDGKLNDSITINSIVPVLFGLTDRDRSINVLKRIGSSEFMTDWGVRTRSNKDPDYDPRSYQKGGVWPFCTGLVALAEFRCGLYTEGLETIKRFVRGLGMGSNYFKEVLYGDVPPTGQFSVQPTGCFIQAWSAGMFLSSTVQGLFGVSPCGYENGPSVTILPFVGQNLKHLELTNVRVGESTFGFNLRMSEKDKLTIKLVNNGPDSALVESGFVLATEASTVHCAQESGKDLQEFVQTKSSGLLRAQLKAIFREGESREFSFEMR